MKSIKSIIEKVATIATLILFAWVIFSWADVLAHNDPFDGDRNYSPINAFVLLGEGFGK